MSLRQVLTLAPLALVTAPLIAQHGSPRQQAMRAVEQMLEARGDASLNAFAEKHLSASYRESFGGANALLQHLRAIRDGVGPIGGVNVTFHDQAVRLHIKNRERESVVAFVVAEEPPHEITKIALESTGPREAGLEVSWDTLVKTLEEAEKNGFCGSVLALRDGEVVLDAGYGYGDPEKRHRVTPKTLFAIGSTPIDFTHAAILKLEEQQMLSLEDALTVWFEDLPADKRGITLEHLRTGRSGLIDFPALDGVDENPDLSWIDRDEFMRRVFASKLLFEPGTNERHSHMAWGVLAAVVEIASGQTYEEYLREHFFGPAGMDRTGNYPITKSFPASEVAVGLGGNTWGEVNAPQYWGETSWLVLGSGGMVSTPGDLARFYQFLRADAGLGEQARRKYGIGGTTVAEGGNDRGFINTIVSDGRDLVIVCSNSHVEMDDRSGRIAMAVARVALSE